MIHSRKYMKRANYQWSGKVVNAVLYLQEGSGFDLHEMSARRMIE